MTHTDQLVAGYTAFTSAEEIESMYGAEEAANRSIGPWITTPFCFTSTTVTAPTTTSQLAGC